MTHTPAECVDRECHEFACKLASWRVSGALVSPAATPNRRSQLGGRAPKNSWERGVAESRPGMPYLDGNLNPIPIKRYGEQRHQIQESRLKLRAEHAKEP